MPPQTPASLDPPSDDRVPIVLGVTGHRSLPEEERLAAAVREEMRALREDYPHSPFAILSPLAEGADRLVAQVAMEELGARLLVPLPLPDDLFREDFQSEASREEFDRLLTAARSVFELELLSGREQVESPGPARDRQYALAGGFVADRCQVLLALWDGKEADGTGGTAEVVRWAREGQVPRQYLPREARDRPFYYPNETACIHVQVPSGDVRRLSGGEGVAGILQRIDQYNRDASAFRDYKGEGPLRRSISSLTGEAERSDVFEQPSMRGLVAAYAAADTLSLGLQGRFRRWLKGIYAVSALAIVSFAALEVWPPAIGLSVLFVALAVGMLAWTGRRDLEDRHLHARALAEGLRVAVFWTAAGIRHHVHDHYLGHHAGELAWTRIALQNVETVCSTPAIMSGGDPSGDEALAERQWVEGQLQYYERAREEAYRKARRFEWAARAAYGASLLLALGATGYVLTTSDWQGDLLELIAVGVEVAVAFGVSFQAYKSKLGLEALGRHYEKASRLFRSARETLQDSERGAKDLLRQLGREAILENGEWLWMNQSRDVETPTLA